MNKGEDTADGNHKHGNPDRPISAAEHQAHRLVCARVKRKAADDPIGLKVAAEAKAQRKQTKKAGENRIYYGISWVDEMPLSFCGAGSAAGTSCH